VIKRQTLLKILVCDDDPQDRKLIRTHLQQITDREIVILEAGRTDEIQTALDKGRIDLVLMDIRMPAKSGIEWLTEIVEKHLAPVVMLTGYGSEEMAVQSLERGAVGYLAKSRLSAESLGDMVDRATEKWRELLLTKANQEQLERLVYQDTLTGLSNRRAILHKLKEAMQQARRYGDRLSMLMLDIDHFKEINDRYGHLVGDDVLEKIASLLQKRIRETDIAGRYGGDEFMVILPKTGLSSALVVAQRIRKSAKNAKMTDPKGNSFSVSLSQGLAICRPGDNTWSFTSRADDALYVAKKNGRNRVETSENPALHDSNSPVSGVSTQPDTSALTADSNRGAN
jgi:diguanylate cyclase (GGDEF)-like protein